MTMSIKDSEKFLRYTSNDFIPNHTRDAIMRYILHGYRPGGFLTSLLSGNSFNALHKADPMNVSNFGGIHIWIIENLPEESYGTTENVHNWINDTNYVRTNYLKIKKQEYIEFVLAN